MARMIDTISSSVRGQSIVAGEQEGLSTSCPPQHDDTGGENLASIEARDHSHSFFQRVSSASRNAVITIAHVPYFLIRSCHLASVRLVAILSRYFSSISDSSKRNTFAYSIFLSLLAIDFS